MPPRRILRRTPPLACSLAALLGAGGCGEEDAAVPLCEVPCAVEFFQAARRCARIDGIDCSGPDCYANGARTYAEAAELRDPAGQLCLKRWGTATGVAWRTGEQRLHVDLDESAITCPDGSTTAASEENSAMCDPIRQPGRSCNDRFCDVPAPLICPAEGCLCRESACAAEFFALVRECAGLEGGEACTFDTSTGEACYANGARVTGVDRDGDGLADLRQLYAPDGETRCLEVAVGPSTYPERGYEARNNQVLAVDHEGTTVRCPDGRQEPACGSPAPENFDDGCDPTSIIVTSCCEIGTCGD